MYVFEVVKENTKYIKNKPYAGKHIHIGYMKVRFKTVDEAYFYYDKHNKHMRPINLYNTGMSDVDPITKLAYIVRKNYDIVETIDPFY